MDLLYFVFSFVMSLLLAHFVSKIICHFIDKYRHNKLVSNLDKRDFEVGETVWYMNEGYVITHTDYSSCDKVYRLYLQVKPHKRQSIFKIVVDSKQVKKVQKVYAKLGD